MKKNLIVIFFLVLVSKSLFSVVVDKVIVKVNKENIMKSEFDKLYNAAIEQMKQITSKEISKEEEKLLKQKVLDQLIAHKLLLQEAKKRNIKVTKRELEEGIKTIKSRFPSDQMFQLELKKENLTQKQFEKQIEEQIMVLKLTEEVVRKNMVKPDESDARELFNKIVKLIDKKDVKLQENEQEELKLLAQLVQRFFDEQVRVRHILIRVEPNASQKEKEEAKKKIMEIKSKIEKGEDFATLAQKFSEDPGSKERGGDLGFIARGDTVEEFEKAAFSLKEGEMSGIVETKFGYHIIRVIEKRPKRKPDFELIKDDLMQYLTRKNAEKCYDEFVETLKKKADVQYLEKIE